MVEIPDYLLERSREARARLSGAPASGSQSESTETAVVAATESAPVAPVSAPPEIEKVEPPKPVAPWVIAAKERKKIPVWEVQLSQSLVEQTLVPPEQIL